MYRERKMNQDQREKIKEIIGMRCNRNISLRSKSQIIQKKIMNKQTLENLKTVIMDMLNKTGNGEEIEKINDKFIFEVVKKTLFLIEFELDTMINLFSLDYDEDDERNIMIQLLEGASDILDVENDYLLYNIHPAFYASPNYFYNYNYNRYNKPLNLV